VVAGESGGTAGPSRRGAGSGAEPAGGIDPITFEVLRHRLWAINDEQGRMAARLSGAPIIYEAYDLNAALMTADGRGLYCGVYIMHHGATIDGFVRRVLAEWPSAEIRDGDMFFTNDPWWGALHANDGILAMPIFAAGELVAWSGIVMHDSDVGSPVPGSFVSGAADRFGEAPLFPAIKLVERFALRRDIERAYLRNSRTPEQNALNMRARVAALRSTHGRIAEVVDRYGLATFRAAQDGIIDYVERVVRRRLRELPDGSWSARGYHDHDGRSDAVYPLCCRLEKDGDALRFDLSGTAAQAPGPINCARPALEGVIAGVLLTFLCHDLPWSIGGLRQLVRIDVPDGTLVSALSPAAVSMASIMAALSAQDVVANAVAQMLLCSQAHRTEAQATWSPGICGGTLAATAPDGATSITLLSESFGGGGGARTFIDGVDSGGVFHSMGSRIANVEALESRGPLLQLFRRQATDAGGAGRFRGGAGLACAVTPHKLEGAGRLITRSSGVRVPAGHGLAGGRPGAPVSQVVLRGSNIAELFAAGRIPGAEGELSAAELEVLEAKSLTPFAPGDVMFACAPGGAGFGDPLRRDSAAVARDVASGLVSVEAAREVYGVVAGDEGATECARSAIRAARLGGSAPRPPRAPDAGELRHPVSDTVVATAAGLTCTVCGLLLGAYDADQATIGVTSEVALLRLGVSFARCREDFILRERSCPGCGTVLAAEVEPADAPAAAGARLRGG
jgi:N-methylhydantoinase B